MDILLCWRNLPRGIEWVIRQKLLMDMAPMFVQSWFLVYQCAMMFIIIKIMDKGSKIGKPLSNGIGT